MTFPIRFRAVALVAVAISVHYAGIYASARPDRQTISAIQSDVIDTLILGESSSERAHALSATASETFLGGLGQPARRLLPLDPPSHNGGSVSFRLKIDPDKQNYVTVKLWGSDQGVERGRLILYMDGNLQVGYRHEGDHDVLNQTDEDPLYKDRFVYQTVALPRFRTQGRTQVDLKISALGRMWPYGTHFAQKQKILGLPSRGIYRVFSHTNPRLADTHTAPDTSAAAPSPRPPMDGEPILATMRETVNSRLARLMRDKNLPAPNPRNAAPNVLLMAEAYHTPWTVAYQNPEAVAVLVQYGDLFLRPGLLGSSWDGAGPLGEALLRLGKNPALDEALSLPVTVAANFPCIGKTVPSAQTITLERREAWSRILLASVDHQRTRGRRSYTNQSMIVDLNIYTANRGLRLLAPALALPEEKTLRYLYESVGLRPWLGNDTEDGGSARPYGSDYHLVSRKGLSRELGYVGSYGETILTFSRDMAELTGDPALREQLIKLQAARSFFRYPSLDADGYRTMKLAAEIDSRVAHFPQPNSAYSIAEVREAWWMEVASFAQDPLSVGITRQSLEDNQYFPRLAQRVRDPGTLGMMRNIDQYAAVQKLPASAQRLPMSDGQPDVVFSDEENAVIALKHGDTRLFVNFYFRQEWGVSGVTRILEVSKDKMRIVTALADFEVNGTGKFWTRPDVIDFQRNGGMPPPGEVIHQAWQGEKLPVAEKPADAREPGDGKWGPFVGKASFYHLRYGNYLFAINTTSDRNFTLPTPKDSARALDLVSGQTRDLQKPVTVEPLSTVVLYLGQ